MPGYEEEYQEKTLKRIHSKYQYEIVRVRNTQEMEEYIANNPYKDKIGFLIDEPIYIHWKPRGTGHISPFYFERQGNKEYFIQCDSLGIPYVLPESQNTSVIRKQYYSPFQRQQNEQGCFEDGVKILIKCFQEANLVANCENNAIKDKTIKNDPGKDADVIVKAQHKAYKNGVDFIERGRAPVEGFYKLTTLPARFLVNIERYDTMRHFQQNEPEKFHEMYNLHETVGEHIRKKGTLRSIAQLDVAQDPNKSGDVKGQDFIERRRRYGQKNKTPDASKEIITARLKAIDSFGKTPVHSNYQITELIRLGGADAFYTHPVDELLRNAATTPEEIDAILSLEVEMSYGRLSLAVNNLSSQCVKHIMAHQASCTINILADAMRNPESIDIAKMLLEKYPLLITQDNAQLDRVIQNLSYAHKPYEMIKLFSTFGINIIAIAETLNSNTFLANSISRLKTIVLEGDKLLAVKKFFHENPPKPGSFWFDKDQTKISIEDIIEHASGKNNKCFGGYSGSSTKKVLARYGIVFDTKMTMDEKSKLCVAKIVKVNQWPPKIQEQIKDAEKIIQHYKHEISAITPKPTQSVDKALSSTTIDRESSQWKAKKI